MASPISEAELEPAAPQFNARARATPPTRAGSCARSTPTTAARRARSALRRRTRSRPAPNADKKAIGQARPTRSCRRSRRAFASALAALARRGARARDLERTVDVTLPGRARRLGHLHPLTLVAARDRADLRAARLRRRRGAAGRDRLPQLRSARDAEGSPRARHAGHVLRRRRDRRRPAHAHLAGADPHDAGAAAAGARSSRPGTVYRSDDDPTHSPMFNQVEGLLRRRGRSRSPTSRACCCTSCSASSASELGVRLRPSFFPFTEPSARGRHQLRVLRRARAAAPCKGTGWIEIGGAGMVDPEVFRARRLRRRAATPASPSAWGIDRMAMLRYGVDDIKLLYEGDVRFAASSSDEGLARTGCASCVDGRTLDGRRASRAR